MNKITRLLLPISAFVGLSLPPVQAAERHLALLVQVSEFREGGLISKIKDPGEKQIDAQEIEAVLKLPKYKFVSTILEQRAATHDAILQNLDHLAQDAHPGDAVLFYFSGHGANNKMQFSLCPYDVMIHSFRNDVTETDIQHWVDKLQAKRITNITLILDSCFSLPGAERGSFVAREKLLQRDPDVQDEQIPIHISPNQAVVLAAAGRNGTAYEALMNPRHPSDLEGVYTAFLCDELKNANPETTFRQLSDRVTYRVTECISRWQSNQPPNSKRKEYPHPQTPGISGAETLTKRPLFRAPDGVVIHAPDVPAYAEVARIEGNRITINRGTAAGVKIGDEYALYPSGEREFTDSQHKEGTFRIDKVGPDQSQGTLVAAPTRPTIAKENRARQTAQHVDLSQNTEIVVQLEGTSGFKSVMKTELHRFSFIKTVDAAEEQMHQIVLRGRETPDNRLEATVYGSDGNTEYTNAAFNGGAAVYHGDNAASVREQLAPFLGQLITIQALFRQTNPSPSFNIALTSGQQSYEIGKDVGDFTFQTEKEGALFLFDIDSAGTPSLLFPSNYHEANQVSANIPMKFPRNGTPFSFNAPAGTDRLIALLITDEKVADAIKTRLFGQAAPPAGSRLTLVMSDLQKIDLQSTAVWNKVICSFLTFHHDGINPR